MADPIVIPEDPEDEFEDADWEEVIDSAKPGGPDGHTQDNSEATLVITVPMKKVRSATRRIMGYSIADNSTPWRLRRPEIPLRHPRWPWLWTSGVSVEPWNPAGNTANSGNKPYVPSVEPIGRIEKTANFTRANLTVRFSRAPGNLWSDDDDNFDPEKEYTRFVRLEEVDPQLDLIVAETGAENTSFHWAETNADTGGPPTGPDPTARFSGGVVERRSQCRYKLAWRGVSVGYVSDTDLPFLRPKRIMDALGTLNSTAMLGDAGTYKPGTLLLDSVALRLYEAPVRTDEFTGLWQLDIILGWLYHDPPRGTVNPSTGIDPVAEVDRRYGHLLLPWRGGAPGEGGSIWYYATRGPNKGTYSGYGSLPLTDHHDVFKHVEDV